MSCIPSAIPLRGIEPLTIRLKVEHSACWVTAVIVGSTPIHTHLISHLNLYHPTIFSITLRYAQAGAYYEGIQSYNNCSKYCFILQIIIDSSWVDCFVSYHFVSYTSVGDGWFLCCVLYRQPSYSIRWLTWFNFYTNININISVCKITEKTNREIYT